MSTSEENYSNHLNDDDLRPNNQVNPELNDQLGFVHYSKDYTNEFTDSRNFVGVDRVQVADMITRRVLLSAHFNEVATLVTDKEVIIAYDRSSGLEADLAESIAEKTAKSFVPKFYEIYVTENINHIERIQQIHLSSMPNDSDRSEIDKFIQELTVN